MWGDQKGRGTGPKRPEAVLRASSGPWATEPSPSCWAPPWQRSPQPWRPGREVQPGALQAQGSHIRGVGPGGCHTRVLSQPEPLRARTAGPASGQFRPASPSSCVQPSCDSSGPGRGGHHPPEPGAGSTAREGMPPEPLPCGLRLPSSRRLPVASPGSRNSGVRWHGRVPRKVQGRGQEDTGRPGLGDPQEPRPSWQTHPSLPTLGHPPA